MYDFYVVSVNLKDRKELNRTGFKTLEEANYEFNSVAKSLDFSIKNVPGGRCIGLYLITRPDDPEDDWIIARRQTFQR